MRALGPSYLSVNQFSTSVPPGLRSGTFGGLKRFDEKRKARSYFRVWAPGGRQGWVQGRQLQPLNNMPKVSPAPSNKENNSLSLWLITIFNLHNAFLPRNSLCRCRFIMRRRFGSGIYVRHSLLNMATRALWHGYTTWSNSPYKLIRKGC